MTQPFLGRVLPLACCLTPVLAQEPQWLGPGTALPAGTPVAFSGTLELPATPDRALVRVAAYDQYRLLINGRGVSIGDTPWDAETYDVTALVRAGQNSVHVAAISVVPAPRNCWLWLRRSLPQAAQFDRLRFRTRGAAADEWLYLEVVDRDGRTSGLYCPEKGRPDLVLGTNGKEAPHTIELRTEPRLDYRPNVGARPDCDFSRIVTVGIRMDRKNALERPAGQVEFLGLQIEGESTVDLGDVAGWRLETGVGEHRRSSLTAGPDGALILRYDFTPAADPKVALDLCAWREGRAIGRLVSGPAWRASEAPVRVTPSPADIVSWTRLALTGPQERPEACRVAGVSLDFGGEDRSAEGATLSGFVRVWALDTMAGAAVEVRVENWAGVAVHAATLPVAWSGADGRAEFQVPKLPRGLYRFTATLGDQTAGPERHTAMAVLAPGQTRLSSIFDTLTPLPTQRGLQGVDLHWGDSAAMLLGLRDQGVNFLQVHLDPHQLDNGEFRELLEFCRATRLRLALNNETANWVAASPDPGGRDRFAAPGGCHRWDLEPGALDQAAATGLFEGVVYDEGEHMQLCRNYYANLPERQHRQPYLVETTGMTLPQAWEAFLAGAQQVADYNRSHGARMLVESVFPALWHPLAKAGVALCPKLLKEDIHPVVLALSLGAATQYGAELWFSPDLWYIDRFPGHRVEDYAAALRLADSAGVDNVYTEAAFALCRLRGAMYELTDYGLALQEFIRHRASAPPRGYTYRDYEPEVAIVRFPDSDWGQASCYYWKTLYGAENLAPTPETGEWLQDWHLLSGGTTDPRGVNANSEVCRSHGWRFAYPSPAVAVFDHLVGDGPLRSARILFLCGITISEATQATVERRVMEGAVCFAPARFCPAVIRQQVPPQLPARLDSGRGAWIVVAGFSPKDLGDYASLLPAAGDTMRLRFRGREVCLPAGDAR